MSIRIVYQDTAPGADDDASVSSTLADSRSDSALLPFGSQNSNNYATLEPNLWVLDGSKSIYDNNPISYWSSVQSNENGTFSTPPTITVLFDAQYTSLGVSLMFSGDSWCNDVDIEWYRGNTQLENKKFHPNSLEYFCENTVIGYSRLVIRLNKTSLPKRRAKLDRILFGKHRAFERDELRNVRLTQEIDVTKRELLANAMDWTLSSKSDAEFIFQFKQPVYAYDGDNLHGVFYVDEGSRVADRLYDIICTDAIGVMDFEPFPDAFYENQNAADLIRSICGEYAVDVHSSFNAKTVTGALVGLTRRGALQQVCFAIGAIADTSNGDKIKIFPLGNTIKEIPTFRTRVGGSVQTGKVVTAIRIASHAYSTTQTEGSEEIDVNGTKYYDTKTVVTIANPSVTASNQPNVIDVMDAMLVTEANIAEVSQIFFDCVSRTRTHSLKFRVDKEEIGDYVQTTTPWGELINGHYRRASIVLSGFALSDAEVLAE